MLEEKQKEKKVEYLELIYDLIFVYLIGRNNSLMDQVVDGFVTPINLGTYILSSLIILQIWYYTSVFINRYGENGMAETVMMLINMFLLYIMGSSTVSDWGKSYGAYMGAWALILVNIAVQYRLKLPKAEDEARRANIRQHFYLILAQAAVAAVSIPVYYLTGYAFGPWAMLLGFAVSPFLTYVPMNFAHITERVMLYVVFSFGEMVITVAGFFGGSLDNDTLYFGLMSFLVVAGLFFSYGYVYDKLLDREHERHSLIYMFLHIFLILCLTNITNALEFMREPEVEALPKTIFLVVSLIGYFFCLALMMEFWSYRRLADRRNFFVTMGVEFALFLALILLTIHLRRIYMAVAAGMIFSQLFSLSQAQKDAIERELPASP